jgi:hypothetical protein
MLPDCPNFQTRLIASYVLKSRTPNGPGFSFPGSLLDLKPLTETNKAARPE